MTNIVLLVRKKKVMGDEIGSFSSEAINSSNIGFKLLQKSGWKEGTGLGISEQGRLEPLQVLVKNDKFGLGVEKGKKKVQQLPEDPTTKWNTDTAETNFEERQLRTGDQFGSCSSTAISSSNIGFQLLKKAGWREGSGLGVSEQGRLEPLQAHVKNNKSGLGAEKLHKKIPQLPKESVSRRRSGTDHLQTEKKDRKISKKLKKMLEKEKQMQEKEFDRAFYREFWPDNV